MAAPKQARLDLAIFPKEPWAKALVEAFNQFALETTQAFDGAAQKFKTLKFKTGAVVANSFPIDMPVAAPVASVRVAQVIRGGTLAGSAITVQWTMLAGGKLARVTLITGLSVNTSYEIKLAME